MPPSGHTPPQGRGWCGGGSGGRGSDQGGQRGDVSTERLPASTRTLRGCLIIGEGWLNKKKRSRELLPASITIRRTSVAELKNAAAKCTVPHALLFVARFCRTI
jgi:hypothetical protein